MTKWVKCSDRMPESKEIVLVFQTRYDEDYIYKSAFIKNDPNLTEDCFMGIDEWDTIDYDQCFDPTHWMPLPQPPNVSE